VIRRQPITSLPEAECKAAILRVIPKRKKRLAKHRGHQERDGLGDVILSIVFAGQDVRIKEVSDKVWLVSFMQYDLGFFDRETGRVTSAENPFGPKVFAVSMDHENDCSPIMARTSVDPTIPVDANR
jgi:hypothetical protein